MRATAKKYLQRVGGIRRAAPVLALVLALLLASAAPAAPTGAADPPRSESTHAERDRLASVLRSDAAVSEKMLACKRLAAIGAAESVPVLAPLLREEELSHGARIALEAIPGPEAAAALRTAAPQLQGALRIGVINSIGARRDAEATELLTEYLDDADPETVAAAAAALGQIGSGAATAALMRASSTAAPGRRAALGRAGLACAESLMAQGDREEAIAVYDRLRRSDLPTIIRLAATRGVILARPSDGVDLLASQLAADDSARFAMALSVARELSGAEVTRIMLEQLTGLPPARRALVIAALGDRADAAARPAVLKAAGSADRAVRIASLLALSKLGDASCLPAILEAVRQNDPQITAAALDSLVAMNDPGADAAIVESLEKAQGNSRRFLIDAAGRRGAASAVPALLEASRDPDRDLQAAALRALGGTLRAGQLSVLTGRLESSGPAELQSAARGALRVACARLVDKETCARQLAAVYPQAVVDTKCFLLDLLGVTGGATALKVVSQGALDPKAEIQDAATRVLGQWPSADAAPGLLEAARRCPNPKLRIRALHGYLRIIRQFDLPVDRKLAMCRNARELAQRDAEKRLLLGAMERIASPKALALVEPYLQTPSLTEAASAAAVSIAEGLTEAESAAAAQAMRKVLAVTKNEDLARRAREILSRTGGEREERQK